MNAQSSSLRRLAAELEAAVDWLRVRGVRVEGSRFSEYLKDLARILSAPGLPARTDDPRFLQVLEALDAGGELIDVHRGMGYCESEEFVSRLKRYAKGPPSQREERSENNSNRARNTGFELFFGARLAQAKFRVELPIGRDLEVPSPLIRIECKRPMSDRGVAAALEDARDQLLDPDASRRPINVIALSVGRALHDGRHFSSFRDPDRAKAEFSQLVDGLVERHQETWRQNNFRHVAGIWLSYSGTAGIPSAPALLRVTFDRIVVRPRRDEPEREAVLRILGEGIAPLMGIRPF